MLSGEYYGASIRARRLSNGVRVWPELRLCCGRPRRAPIKRSYV